MDKPKWSIEVNDTETLINIMIPPKSKAGRATFISTRITKGPAPKAKGKKRK
jgi:hypothetical protein